MVGDVPDPVDRAAEGRLITERMRSRIDHHVPHDPDIMHAAVDLEGVVMKIGHVIVVKVDCDWPPVPILSGRIMRAIDCMGPVRVAVCLDMNSGVEIRYV